MMAAPPPDNGSDMDAGGHNVQPVVDDQQDSFPDMPAVSGFWVVSGVLQRTIPALCRCVRHACLTYFRDRDLAPLLLPAT